MQSSDDQLGERMCAALENLVHVAHIGLLRIQQADGCEVCEAFARKQAQEQKDAAKKAS